MRKLFFKWWNLKDEYFVFLTSLVFYASLYFNLNNKTLLGLLFIFLFIFYQKFKSLPLALFLIYLLFLPFGKGKTYYFTLIPAWLINSEFPYTYALSITFADIAFLVLFIMILRQEILNHKGKNKFFPSDIFFIIFLFFSFISIFFSQFQIISYLAFLKLFRITIAFFLIQKLFSEYRLGKIVPAVLAALLMFESGWASLQAVLQRPLGRAIEIFGTQYSIYGHVAAEDTTFFRSVGTFEHPNTLGSFLVMFLAFFTIQFFNQRLNKEEKKVIVFSIIAGILGLIFSASRSSWGVFGVISFLELWFLRKQKILLMTPAIKWATIGVVSLLAVLFPFIIFPRLEHLYITALDFGGIYYRFYLLEKAWILGLESPFGVGLATFPAVLIQRFGFFTWPTPVHNLILEILSETGIFSLLAFLLFLIFSYKRFWEKIRHPGGRRPIGSHGILSLRSRMTNNYDVYFIKFGAFFATLGFLGVAQFYPFFWSSGIFEYFWLFLGIMVY